ncbi:uncharacterized protein [Watersipora subatra]|uniref:uncharacterized protein n=1 Tax=Watersipora subatra TaxID=2589382 RepID=UPI00355B3ACE
MPETIVDEICELVRDDMSPQEICVREPVLLKKRKMYPIVVMQAVVDVQYLFRDVYAKTPGSAHDAAVFRRSRLSTLVVQNMSKRDKTVHGKSLPLHILGDPAYPMARKIIKGFTGANLSPEKESFNVYHSKARMWVEIAFGRLKARWRMLQKCIDVKYKLVPKLITTCCILHNILEKLLFPPPSQQTSR